MGDFYKLEKINPERESLEVRPNVKAKTGWKIKKGRQSRRQRDPIIVII